MTSGWKKAGKRALTPMPCWLTCNSASPEAAHFGVIPMQSSALAQASCGKGVRALAQLLQHWEMALARTRENSWAEKSILQSRTALSNSDTFMITALPLAEWWASPSPGATILQYPEEQGRGGHQHRSLSPGSRDLDHRLTATTSIPSPLTHGHAKPNPALQQHSLGCATFVFRLSLFCAPQAGGCGPGTPSLHSHCTTKPPGWGQQWLQADAQEQD